MNGRPMTVAEYKTAKPGDRVRTLRSISNHHFEIPAGTVMTVTYKRSGFNLKTDPCVCCEVRLFITHVQPGDVETMPAQEGDT